MKQRNKLTYPIFILLVVLGGTEIILRLWGYQPGVFRQIDGFQKVDSLILYKNFETDDSGIYKFSKWVSDSLVKYYDPKWGRITNPEVKSALYPVDNLDDIVRCYKYITNPELFNPLLKTLFLKADWESATLREYRRVLSVPDDYTDEWSKAVKNYLFRPFNTEGFRSIEFKKHKTKRKRIFIIGDSFVYGMSPTPFYNSFYDILLSKGYMIYAAGIPGTDPAQYAAIAEKYIPILEPDLVIVCFYPGNDIMSFPRTPKPEEPHEHITNAGFFESNINGKYYNAQDAYQHYLSLITIPENGNTLNKVLRKTAIGSLIWEILRRLGITYHFAETVYSQQNVSESEKTNITQQYIQRYENTCQQLSISCISVVIPTDYGESRNNFLICDSSLMSQILGNNYYYPDSFNKQKHFPKNDVHFNNAGHQLFADYLKCIIDTLK